MNSFQAYETICKVLVHSEQKGILNEQLIVEINDALTALRDHLGFTKVDQKPQQIEQSKEEWLKVHQPFELDFHQKKNYRWDTNAFMGQWQKLFGGFLGLAPDSFGKDQVLLDIGCGSRPCFDWFNEVPQKYSLDPLLSDYMKIPEMQQYWLTKNPQFLLSQPAEILYAPIAGKCDYVQCWNVLDHTYDWKQILQNMADYAKPGAIVLLGTDLDPHGPGHPGIDDRNYFFKFLEQHFFIRERKDQFTHREVAFHMIRK